MDRPHTTPQPDENKREPHPIREDSQLRALQSELDRALRIRKAMVSVTSHDVRGSLAAVRLTANALLRTFRSGRRPDDSDIESALQDLDRETAALIGTIEKLLVYAALEANDIVLQREAADLSEIASEAVASLRDEAAAAGVPIEISSAGPVVGRWDRARVHLGVTNLLQNSLRHAPGMPVQVSVQGTAREGLLIVTDRGPGIPEALSDSLFEPFVRGHGKKGWFGLGLWIAHRIAALHGGDLTVENLPDRGARATLSLPLEIPDAR